MCQFKFGNTSQWDNFPSSFPPLAPSQSHYYFSRIIVLPHYCYFPPLPHITYCPFPNQNDPVNVGSQWCQFFLLNEFQLSFVFQDSPQCSWHGLRCPTWAACLNLHALQLHLFVYQDIMKQKLTGCYWMSVMGEWCLKHEQISTSIQWDTNGLTEQHRWCSWSSNPCPHYYAQTELFDVGWGPFLVLLMVVTAHSNGWREWGRYWSHPYPTSSMEVSDTHFFLP